MKNKHTILIVEDERISAEAVKVSLTSHGFLVGASVATGEEAVAQAEKIKPDLVLMDIKLRGEMDGIEAAQTIVDHLHIPIVYLTAFTDKKTLQRIKKTKPHGFILKPFEENELIGVIETALYKHQMERKLEESEIRFRQFFENDPEYCYMISNDSIIIDVNKSALKALGYKKKELVDQHAKKICSLETLSQMKALFSRRDRTKVLRDKEMTLVTKKGKKLNVLLSASVVRDSNGNVLYTICVQKDITQRIKAEQALRESEKKYRKVVDSSLDLIFSIDAEGYILFTNIMTEHFTGYDQEAVLGHHFTEYVHPDDVPQLLANMQRLLNDEPPEGIEGMGYEMKYRLVKRDKQIIQVATRSSVIRDDEGNIIGLTGISRDISDHVKLEKTLQEKEEHLRTILNTVQAGIMVIDPQTYTIEEANSFVFEAFGASKDEVIGSHCHNFLCPGDKPLCPFINNEGNPDQFTHQLIKADGEVIPIFKSVSNVILGGKQRIIETFIDISERVLAEQALQEKQKELLEAQHLAHIGNWSHNLITGEIQWSDESFRITGHTPSKLNFDFVSSIIHPDDLAILEMAMQESQKGKGEADHEFRIIRPDGEVRYIHNRWKSIYDDEGNEIKQIGTHQDITERKHAEEKIRQLNTELERRVDDRTAELRRMVNLMAGREVRMIELKEVIQGLRQQIYDAGLQPGFNDPLRS